ncbi:hypothetical protein C5Y97_09670 [Blastopirellula marina]|uniref:Uncharacterized protein n=1 Tax=Blastopirellula marina TaxID=124 RepID=A0A2S8G1J7_9BACT|nr:hypothetical protein C5Y98_09665 [Blastopirellula marina]PTL44981.1 hypothetical protein C5Y97_09670 [Blastopirellula marina]
MAGFTLAVAHMIAAIRPIASFLAMIGFLLLGRARAAFLYGFTSAATVRSCLVKVKVNSAGSTSPEGNARKPANVVEQIAR